MIARSILGWSDEEFWSATPRKLFAVYYTYLSLRESINNAVAVQNPLVGKAAVEALQGVARNIR